MLIVFAMEWAVRLASKELEQFDLARNWLAVLAFVSFYTNISH